MKLDQLMKQSLHGTLPIEPSSTDGINPSTEEGGCHSPQKKSR